MSNKLKIISFWCIFIPLWVYTVSIAVPLSYILSFLLSLINYPYTGNLLRTISNIVYEVKMDSPRGVYSLGAFKLADKAITNAVSRGA